MTAEASSPSSKSSRARFALALLAALSSNAACRGKATQASKAKASAQVEEGAAEGPEAAEPADPAEPAATENSDGERTAASLKLAAPPADATTESFASAFFADLAWHHPDSEMFFAGEVAALQTTPIWHAVIDAWLARRAPRTQLALRACPSSLAELARFSLGVRMPSPDIFATLVLRGIQAKPLLDCLRQAAPELAADGLTADDFRAPALTLRARTSDSTDVLSLRAAGESVIVATFGTASAEGDDANAVAMRDTPGFVALVKAAPPRTALWFAMVGSSGALATLQRRGISLAYLSGSLSTVDPAETATASWKLEAQLHTATPQEAARYAKAARTGAPIVEVSARGNDVMVKAEGSDEQLRAFLAREAALPAAP